MNYEEAASRCWLEVDLDALRANYHSACGLAGSSLVIPVLKANAYGMGAAEVARALRAEGARLFAVATPDEAMQIADAAEGADALCMGLAGEDAARKLIARGLALTIYAREQGERVARIAAALGRPARAHFKLDTGLHRLGFDIEDAPEAIARLCAGGWISPEGLYTHLAIHSPESDHAQLRRLLGARDALAARGVHIPLVHALDSIGLARYPEFALDAVRVGAWLYGVPPSGARAACRPVARFCARVSQLRCVRRGELIGYDDDHPLLRDSLVASVSAGYIDGTPRRGEGWQVELRGHLADVLGIACMDQLMIDATDVPGAAEGDVVTFVGGAISVDEYARMGALNHNEAWARIGRRVPRIYFEEGRPVRVRTEL